MKLHGTSAILPNGHLAIGGVDTVSLVSEYGSPLWVVDEEHFRANCRAFREAFSPELFPGGVEVVYASKALLTFAICRIVAEEGLGLDVVSGGELHVAVSTDFPLDHVFCHGNNKPPAEITQALQAGVGRFMVDNLQEIEWLEAARAQLAPRQRAGRVSVLLRVTPGVEAGNHDYIKTAMIDSKFGVAIATGQAARAVDRILASPALELVGLHCHLGSQIFDVTPHCKAAGILMDFAAAERERTGWTAREISLGGGFGVRYANGDATIPASSFAQAIAETLEAKVREHRLPAPKLLVEPGRAICATAGWTLYTVGNVKEIPGIRTYVAIDGSMSDNPRRALYHARHEVCLANRAAEKSAGAFTVAGRCCESGDILVDDADLPSPRPGDVLAVSCTGAYNYTMSMNYNRLPRPAMVLVGEGRADVILRRETYEDIAICDVVPERLAPARERVTALAGARRTAR